MCSLMDKASDYESGNSGPDGWIVFLKGKQKHTCSNNRSRCFKKKIVVITSSLTKFLKNVLFSNLEQYRKNRVIKWSLPKRKKMFCLFALGKKKSIDNFFSFSVHKAFK